MKSALALDKDSYELFEFEDDEEEGIDNGAEFDWELGDFDVELTEFERDEEVRRPTQRGGPGSRGRTRFARPSRLRRGRPFRRGRPRRRISRRLAFPLRRRRLTVGFPPEETLQGTEFVRWVQASLNRVLALRLAVNGILGPETRSAVRRFQERERLPVTGIVGPDTERALIAALAGIAPAEPARVAPAEPAEPEPSEGELDDLEFAGDWGEWGEEAEAYDELETYDDFNELEEMGELEATGPLFRLTCPGGCPPAGNEAGCRRVLRTGIEGAIRLANRAASLLEARPRSARTVGIFGDVFGHPPNRPVPWGGGRDSGGIVARRYRLAVRALRGRGTLYQCAPIRALARRMGPGRVLLGPSFWRQSRNHRAAIILHEMMHQYFLMPHEDLRPNPPANPRERRRNNAYCYEVFAMRASGIAAPAADEGRCKSQPA